MISALTWVPKGAANVHPTKFDMNDEEFQKIAGLIGDEVDVAKLELEMAKKMEKMESTMADEESEDEQDHADGMDDIEEATEDMQEEVPQEQNVQEDGEDEMAKYKLDEYDNEDEGLTGIPVFGNSKGLTYYASNDEDPYILVKNPAEDDQEELDELEIFETDNLILACRTEDDLSHLEVYVYESEHDNLYVHHDIMLPSFPLCVEWMNYKKGESKGNSVAVGTFDPEIEIWDLDVVDVMYPTSILGRDPNNAKDKLLTRKKRQKARLANAEFHVGAVTSLSWNKHQQHLLLSGSADSTVKLWDLNTKQAVNSYNHHKANVAAVCWHPVEVTVFLTGGYDEQGRVCALDSRAPDQVASWALKSDVECLKWDPFRSERFYASTEDGLVRCFDARQVNQGPLYTIHAHDAAVSALDLNAAVEGMLVTGSADKQVKLWDIREGQQKQCITSRDVGVGKVFSAGFCPDSPFVLAVAGSKGKMVVWNLQDNIGVKRTFKKDLDTSETKKEFVGLETDDEESDHEEMQEEDMDR